MQKQGRGIPINVTIGCCFCYKLEVGRNNHSENKGLNNLMCAKTSTNGRHEKINGPRNLIFDAQNLTNGPRNLIYDAQNLTNGPRKRIFDAQNLTIGPRNLIFDAQSPLWPRLISRFYLRHCAALFYFRGPNFGLRHSGVELTTKRSSSPLS